LGDEGAEALRQQVVADQAAALEETAKAAAAKSPKAKTTKTKTKTTKSAPKPKAKPAKTAEANPAPTAKAKPAKTVPTGTVTVLAKENPHKAGTRRHTWFKLLKTGMSVVEAVKAGVRSTYLQRMHASGVIKLSDK
jgi:hypothetical protein